ncbi:acyl-CoA N-acyltransferase [Talaromyces proteolyticus]|uniref:Acyl-CoA N-acyltransferase n=1 Tax=Talaromyces proteolyticus TaxID=1131652 RepID=A0AAD4PVZ9_9EURO|nr:acyl-CoA N-acyltransferase [Talaromyces proteolyticus]KAH8697305.1 acyl-CoA N-acyltransferase [Talaromyces proteolyticus]
MTIENESKMELPRIEHDIRHITNSMSDEDFEKIWQMWQTIFPKWPIERQRMEILLRQVPVPGQHYIHEKGFCLSFLADGAQGKIAAVGVLREYRGKGLGTAFIKKAQDGLRIAARANGEGELKSLEIGSQTPRFWPQVPMDFPSEVKDFFLRRGFHKSTKPIIRDFYKDIRGDVAPPKVLERVSKMNFRFSPWSPELYEECITKQRATFSWFKGYEVLAAYNQHHEVMVAFDPDTNTQIGWTLMCSHSAILTNIYAFMPLMPSKEKTGLIAAVGVDESARGKGVGLALMVKAIENMRERGIEGVFIDSVVIQGFYERLGFKPCWEYESFVWPS